MRINADNYTVFGNSPIHCRAELSFKPKKITAYADEVPISVIKQNGSYYIVYYPKKFGDIRLTVLADGIHTYAEFYHGTEPDVLMKKRLYFIAEKQQYKRADSSLYGAYLVYNNVKKYPIFDSSLRNHNVCRERVGMALLMCHWLQKNGDAFLQDSLNKFIAFAPSGFFEPKTGEVFDGIGKNREFVRLYNAPWVTMLLAKMYNLTDDGKHLEYCIKCLRFYYGGGGYKFYPNAFSMLLIYSVFKKAKMTAKVDEIFGHLKKHADNIARNGLSYPKHEVNYEQTILSPAVTILSEFAVISGDNFYAEEAEKHIKLLERFNGRQPICHMNETPIRYWDDFWFVDGRQQGDTFPHYCNCLTARAFLDYYNIGGGEKYKSAAAECIRNCFCLFNERGEGSCAYVYPYKVNGNKG